MNSVLEESPVNMVALDPKWKAGEDLRWLPIQNKEEMQYLEEWGQHAMTREEATELIRRIIWKQLLDGDRKREYGKLPKTRRADRGEAYERAQHAGKAAGKTRTEAGRPYAAAVAARPRAPIGAPRAGPSTRGDPEDPFGIFHRGRSSSGPDAEPHEPEEPSSQKPVLPRIA